MAASTTIPKVLYNFNENSATTIRDYSENGNDGTGTGLFIQASARVGNECVFNAVADQIDLGNITDLNGSSALGMALAYKPTGGAGTLSVLNKSGQITITYNYTTNILKVDLVVASGTATVSATLVIDTYYDIGIGYNGSTLVLYIDEVLTDTDGSQSGVIATNGNTMYLGTDGVTNSANFVLNEFKFLDVVGSTDNLAAWAAEQNGVKVTTSKLHGYSVGDIIGSNINTSYSAYAIVTFVESTTIFRILPLTDEIGSSSVFQRCGHLWDTTRQWMFIIDDTPQICFYDGVSKSSEVLAGAKKTVCITKDGITGASIVKSSITKTANYTVLSTDQRIYVDSSGGAFTITLESSPATDRELEIIDSVGSCGTNAVTVAGNGNNINGTTPQNMNANYDSWHIVFNGTQWNLK